VLLQHDPSRAVQGLVGKQAVPLPWNVLVPVQDVLSVIVQVPVLLQQAPVLGQGLTKAHAVPMPWKFPVQAVADAVIVHAPVVVLQHAPAVVPVHATAVLHAPPSETLIVNGAGAVVVLNVLTMM
jgi:hypothetical protein